MGSLETFSIRTFTRVGCPAGTRPGLSWRTQPSRYRVRPAASADSSGRSEEQGADAYQVTLAEGQAGDGGRRAGGQE